MSDSDDEDLEKAIALSLADQSAEEIRSKPSVHNKTTISNGISCTNGRSNGADTTTDFLRLRKIMEEERLARQAARVPKRNRSITPPPLRNQKVARLDNDIVSSSAPAVLQPIDHSLDPAKVKDLSYPRGIVKKTWALNYERTGGDVKIEEVLERSTLRTAVLSGFQWDSEWLQTKLDYPRTKLIYVMQGKTEESRRLLRQDVKGAEAFLRLCFPPMEGQVNCMHSKLMLLFHPHKLRVVVPTANLTKYDWGETGVMENTVFMIDLPRDAASTVMTPFAEELFYFVDKKGLDDDVKRGLRNFDWSATRDMAFVHSVGGVSYGEAMHRTGLAGLSQAVCNHGLATDDLKIDFAASSIGSLSTEYLQLMQYAARGQLSTAVTKGQSPNIPKTDVSAAFRVYFPTNDVVQDSNRGPNSGGTICLQRSYFTSAKFPRSCFRNYQSKRKGLLSHNKILYARGKAASERKAWAYIGSANMSESAWGKFTMDKQKKELKITCRNWECGVLLPVRKEEDVTHKEPDGSQGSASTVSEAGDKIEALSMDVFDDLLPVPFQYPGEEYGDRQPWYFKERFS